MSAAPIFITGAQRTGTSWVAATLATAKGAVLVDEPFNHKKRDVGICSADFPYWFTHIDAHNGGQYVEAVRRTLTFRYNLIGSLRKADSRQQWRLVLALWARMTRHRMRLSRPVVKQPTGLFMAPWLASEFGAKVVVMIRHPAGYVSSRVRLGWPHDFADFRAQPALMAGKLAPVAAEIAAFQGHGRSLVDQISLLWRALYVTVHQYQRTHPDWVFLRLEDVARRPVAQFKDLYARLGLPFTPAVEKMITAHSHAANPSEVPVTEWKSLRRASQMAVNTWRDRLKPADIARIREWTAPVADYFYDDESWV